MKTHASPTLELDGYEAVKGINLGLLAPAEQRELVEVIRAGLADVMDETPRGDRSNAVEFLQELLAMLDRHYPVR